MPYDSLGELAEILVRRATAAGVMVVTAESCTGGRSRRPSGRLAPRPFSTAAGDLRQCAKRDLLAFPLRRWIPMAPSPGNGCAMAEGALASHPSRACGGHHRHCRTRWWLGGEAGWPCMVRGCRKRGRDTDGPACLFRRSHRYPHRGGLDRAQPSCRRVVRQRPLAD